MNISKNKGLSLVTLLIVLVVYNLIAFLLPFERTGMFWVGYGFSMGAILLTTAVSFYAFQREGLKSKVYGWSLVSLVWRYLVVQLIVGFLEKLLSFIPFQYGLILNAILLAACLIGLIATDLGKDEVERIDQKIKEKVFYIKSLQMDIENLVDQVKDASTKKELRDVAQAIRYSDPMSGPQLAGIENKMDAKVGILFEAVEQSDFVQVKSICGELQRLIAQRNRLCKTLK